MEMSICMLPCRIGSANVYESLVDVELSLITQ